MVVQSRLMLGLLVVTLIVAAVDANTAACSNVPAATSDTSAAAVQFVKASTVLDAVCPGSTFSVALTFPNARTWQVIATKGSCQGATGTCKNQMAGSTAVKKVDTLKLYLGCTATGSVKVSVLSKAPNDAGLLLKTVSKRIKALSECPQSACSAPTPASASAAPTPASSPQLNLTGNPMVDMQSVFTLMYGAAANGQDPFGAVLNFGTAMQVIAGMSSLKDKGVEAAGALKTMQLMLNMIPAGSGNSAFLTQMKSFLSIATEYMPTGAAATTTQQQMGNAVLDVISGMAGMAGMAYSGQSNSLLAMVPLLRVTSGMTNMLNILPLFTGTSIGGLPGTLPATGATTTTTGTTTPTGNEAGPAGTTPTTGTTTTTTDTTTPAPTPEPTPADTTGTDTSYSTGTTDTSYDPNAGS